MAARESHAGLWPTRAVANKGCGAGTDGPILLWLGCGSEVVLPLSGPFIWVTGTAWLAAGAG